MAKTSIIVDDFPNLNCLLVYEHVACVFTNNQNVYSRWIKSKKNDRVVCKKTCYYFFVENIVGKTENLYLRVNIVQTLVSQRTD